MRRLAPPLAPLAATIALACSGPPDDGGTDATSGTTTSASGSPSTDASETVAGETASTTGDVPVDYGVPGPHPVGNARFTLAQGDRPLLVELWYPAAPEAAAAAAVGAPLADFVPEGPDRSTLEGLLAALSPAGQIGTRLQTASAFGAAPAAGAPFPVVVFSHCHNCARFSAFSVAEHLASHGYVVAAPDHPGNTLFDGLAGDDAPLDDAVLQLRRADLGAVLDALLSDALPLPELRGLADPSRVGALGHSYGAATVGRWMQEDPRIRAAVPLAAPIESPLFPGTQIAAIHGPLLFLLAEEDNSIKIIGNNLLISNFKAAHPPAWLVRVRDAGHWGVSDICGLTDAIAAGCGEGTRQTAPGEPFTYLDVAIARRIAGAYALAFFDAHLRGDPTGLAYLAEADPAAWVSVEARL